jgi:hypothetical protein
MDDKALGVFVDPGLGFQGTVPVGGGSDEIRRPHWNIELLRFAYADDESGDFHLEFTDFFEVDLYADFKLVTDQIITVTHFGPNLLTTHMVTDEDARAELGISLPDLVDGSGELKELFEEAILSVQSVR